MEVGGRCRTYINAVLYTVVYKEFFVFYPVDDCRYTHPHTLSEKSFLAGDYIGLACKTFF